MGVFDRLFGKDTGSGYERSCPIGFDVTDSCRRVNAPPQGRVGGYWRVFRARQTLWES
jgi:hypothetical protein